MIIILSFFVLKVAKCETSPDDVTAKDNLRNETIRF